MGPVNRWAMPGRRLVYNDVGEALGKMRSPKVESKGDAVTKATAYFRFEVSPFVAQDPHAMFRFHLPLIEPDVRFSRIRLSDQGSRVRSLPASRAAGEKMQSQLLVQVRTREACDNTTPYLVLHAQPSAEPTSRVFHDRFVGWHHSAHAEVIRPATQFRVQVRNQFPHVLPSRAPVCGSADLAA